MYFSTVIVLKNKFRKRGLKFPIPAKEGLLALKALVFAFN